MLQAETFDIGRALLRANAGMASAAQHADAERPGWLESAVQAVRDYANVTADIGTDFTMEEARRDIEHKLPRPPRAARLGCRDPHLQGSRLHRPDTRRLSLRCQLQRIAKARV